MNNSIKIIFVTLLCFTLFSCKRDYTCYCPSPTNDDPGVQIKDTKEGATKKCDKRENPYGDYGKCEIYGGFKCY